MQRNKYYFQFLKNFIKTQNFKFILLMLLINTFYGGYLLYSKVDGFSYAQLYINCFSAPYFLIILYFLLIISSFSTYFQLIENYEYMIRLNNKKSFFLKLTSYTGKNMFIVLIIQILLFTITFTFTNGISDFIFSEIFYIIYYIAKVYIIALLINELNLILFNFFNKYIVILLNIFLYSGLVAGTSWMIFNSGSYALYGYFGDYLNTYKFPNLLMDISSFSLYCCIFICIVNIITKINELYQKSDFNKIKNKAKYILFNDISFFKEKSYVVYVIGYIILSILSFYIFKITGSIMNMETIYDMLGLNVSFKNDVLSISMFGLHFIFSIYIVFFLFTNNIRNGIDNVFLRIKSKNWILYKLFSVATIYFIIKVIIYCMLSLILSINKIDINIFSFILLDYLYFLIVSCISLLIYILPLLWQILILIFIFILSCIFPLFKVISFINCKIVLLIILLVVVFVIKMVFSKLYTNVFEKIRR